jgi:hypothetical protein
MHSNRHLPSARRALATAALAALAALALANTPAHATVWNVNIGNEITTSDNFAGAAAENTPNSFWNSVTTGTPTNQALSDSTGATTTATLTLAVPVRVPPLTINPAGYAPVTGLELFSTWIKTSDNATPFTMTIGGLSSSPGVTYDLIVYSDWYWKGNEHFPVTQTVGSGLTGTVYLDQISTGTDGVVPALVQDSNLALDGATEGNWIRINGLIPDGSGNLGFSMGGRNSAFSGFQLIQVGTGAPDNTPPTPSPMTWASAPAAASGSSITMTATTASDASGVEYFFDETSGNPGGSDSGWLNSPTYIDTGLSASTTYTYTVKARDKSVAQNETLVSSAASATTTAPDATPPTPNPMTWATPPVAVSSSSITMTATTASDASGVEYFFDETTGNLGGSDSSWQNSPTYIDTGLSASTTYTYTVKARDKSSAQNETLVSSAASATTNPPPSGAVVWNVNIGNQITPADNYAGAVPQSTPINWNSITATSYTGLALEDSSGSTAGGIALDLTSDRAVGGQALTSGDKIFLGYFGGAGAGSSFTLRGLTVAKTYDILFYSDWYWKDGDSLPITQTAGTGLAGTFYLNRILSGTYGTVPALTQDTNPANVTSGAGNIGNYCRIVGIVPDIDGKVSFRIGDGANTAFSGFQLVKTGDVAPRADMLTFGLPGNPAVISGTNITLTLPYNSNVTNLSPTFALWPGATCVPVSGTARNFTTPQTYTVTSSDSQVTKPYTATAVISPPLPEFYLTAPATWDGRQTITVQPTITNLALLQATGGTNFNYQWSVSGVAVTKQVSPGVLTLTRSQGSGSLVVTLTMDNGTTGVTNSTTIHVREPATDPWVERTPGATEKPVTGQFFARNPDTGLGTIYYNGTQSGTPNSVYLKVYKTPSGGLETLHATHRQSLVIGAYAFSAAIPAGLITYRVVYGTTTGATDTDVATVTDLVCGDAYIIEGQSNAVATDNSEPQVDTSYQWIHTYNPTLGWGPAFAKPTSPKWDSKIGFWAMKLGQNIVATHQMPVCFINGAVGGTRIDQHQPNPANHTVGAGTYDIYANLLNRVMAAKLTHGIRGIFWHQGESDCSNFGPILDYDYTTYQQLFLDMSAAWKQDYPNFQKYIIFQVMPKPCGIGPKGDQLREVQRTLPFLYSKMSILNTLGFAGDGGCHFTKAGYESIADRILPLVSRDFHGIVPSGAVTAPNLKRAYFTSAARTAIALEFDQAMSWSSFSMPNYYVDKVGGKISSGSATGNIVTLQLSSAAAATATLDYLEDSIWNLGESVSSLLYGANGIPALTFADVPIAALGPYGTWANGTFAHAFTDTAATSDPDGDGKSNQEEFAFGLDPTTGSSVNPITQQLAGGVFKYTRTANSGLTYKVYYSTTLSAWTLDASATQTPAAAVGGVETVTATLAAAAPLAGKLFVRVEATQTP